MAGSWTHVTPLESEASALTTMAFDFFFNNECMKYIMKWSHHRYTMHVKHFIHDDEFFNNIHLRNGAQPASHTPGKFGRSQAKPTVNPTQGCNFTSNSIQSNVILSEKRNSWCVLFRWTHYYFCHKIKLHLYELLYGYVFHSPISSGVS